MKHAHAKPWSHLDDEPIAGDSAPVESAPASTHSIERGGDWRDISGFIRALGGWPIVLMVLGAIWAVAAILYAHHTGFKWHLIAVMIINCGGLAAHFINVRRSSAGEVPRGLAGSHSDASPGDEAGMMQHIDEHTRNIETRVAELLEERKQIHLEASLASSQKKLIETILNSLADPLLVTDRFDQVVFINSAAIELLQLHQGEYQRKPIDSLIPDEKLIRMIRQAREADSRAARRRMEQEIAGRAYAVSISPFIDSPGGGDARHGVTTIFRDITRERETSRAKSEFVAHVSHELRTPLSSIRAYVEMLVDGEAADEKTREEYYQIIHTSAERLDRLIDNMLNISRIEAGTVRINKERVAISMIAKEVTDSLRPQAEQKQIELIAELAPVVDQVLADRDLMYQALLNLVSNAIKYTPAGGQIMVRMFSQDETNTIRIEVSDTGVGIPPEDLPRVFEKFFRVQANKDMAKGTGLGLNLVKNIVEVVHEGKLTLTSTVGKGSTFAITLAKLQ